MPPLFVVASGIELGDFLQAVSHHHANATVELIIVLFQERRHRHAAPTPRHGGLSAHEHWRDLDGSTAGRLIGDRQADIHFREFPG